MVPVVGSLSFARLGQVVECRSTRRGNGRQRGATHSPHLRYCRVGGQRGNERGTSARQFCPHTRAACRQQWFSPSQPGRQGWQIRYGHRPIGTTSLMRLQASRYIRMLQSRRSLLVWKVFGRRPDGFSNDDHPSPEVPGNASTRSWPPGPEQDGTQDRTHVVRDTPRVGRLTRNRVFMAPVKKLANLLLAEAIQ